MRGSGSEETAGLSERHGKEHSTSNKYTSDSDTRSEEIGIR